MVDTSKPTLWFLMGKRWHCQESMTETERLGLCKIRVIGDPPVRGIQGIGPGGLYPDDACHTCRQIIAFGDITEESTEKALSRGYFPAELADPSPNSDI